MKRQAELLLLAVAASLVAFACLGTGQVEKFYRGRSLTIQTTGIYRLDHLSYRDNDTGANLVAEPSAPSLEMVLISMGLINFSAGQVSLVIDEDAATLVDEDDQEYQPFDPLARAQVGDAPLSRLGLPRLWGQFDLQQNLELRGFLYFEVPKGTKLHHMIWEETDRIRVDF